MYNRMFLCLASRRTAALYCTLRARASSFKEVIQVGSCVCLKIALYQFVQLDNTIWRYEAWKILYIIIVIPIRCNQGWSEWVFPFRYFFAKHLKWHDFSTSRLQLKTTQLIAHYMQVSGNIIRHRSGRSHCGVIATELCCGFNNWNLLSPSSI